MIYHITTRDAWEKARSEGDYRPESLETQGFIHLSGREQIVRVANAVYHGQTDLVILSVDETLLGEALRYEPPDTTIPAHHYTGELFPHLYAVLSIAAVKSVTAFPPEGDGRFSLPEALP